jgi:hypothetical protein
MLTNTSKRLIIVETLYFAFILLFAYGAFAKLTDLQLFRSQIGKSPIISPLNLTMSISIGLPLAELIVCFLLMFDRFRMIGLYLFLCFMVIFSCYIIAILKYADFIPCSCGGILENMSWVEHLWFKIRRKI